MGLRVLILCAAVLVTACSNSDRQPGNALGAPYFTLGVDVSGLASGTVLLLQANQWTLPVSANGRRLVGPLWGEPFLYQNGTPYSVAVRAQPFGQTCQVSGSSGVLSASVMVPIACTTGSHIVGGRVSGLTPGASVVLQNNGADNLTIGANGAFVFATPVAGGNAYRVTVLAQPAGQICTVSRGMGAIPAADVASVSVACSTATFSVGGTVSGLVAGTSVVLRNNGADDLAASANGNFVFPIPVASGEGYSVSVFAPPAAQLCRVSQGSGSGTSNISNVAVSCGTGNLALLAGSTGGLGMADGASAIARFNAPQGIARDASGSVYVADTDNHTIRRITAAGVVTTFGGVAGSPGSTDGSGAAARFRYPTGVAVDAAGNVYVTDTGNHTIRRITPGGAVTTLAGLAGNAGSSDGAGVAGRFYAPTGVAVDSAGIIYVADTYNHTIRKITPAGDVSTFAGTARAVGIADGTGAAARFAYPGGIAVDSAGLIYVADTNNHTIRRITSAGDVSTFAGMAGAIGSADGAGSIARFAYPLGVAADNAGNIYVADHVNHAIRKMAPSGDVVTVAGTARRVGSVDGSAGTALFAYPAGVAVDGASNVYIADSYNHAIRVLSAGTVSTWAGSMLLTGATDGTGSAALFNVPYGVTSDGAGFLYVADSGNSAIRKVSAGGSVVTVAGTAGSPGSADGTGAAARFQLPRGVVADSAGNIFVADTFGNTIRKLTATGEVTSLAGAAGFPGADDGTGSAARFSSPSGVALDSAGNLYVADAANHAIRKVTPAGVVTTFAGSATNSGSADGAGPAARFNFPTGIAADAAGNMYVVDSANNAIRRITPAGDVSTLAGTAGTWGSADGVGSTARFNAPLGIAGDGQGNFYVTDTGNHTLRVVSSGGMVSTIAGVPGMASLSPGTLPGLLASPLGVTVVGNSAYVTMQNGIVAIQLP